MIEVRLSPFGGNGPLASARSSFQSWMDFIAGYMRRYDAYAFSITNAVLGIWARGSGKAHYSFAGRVNRRPGFRANCRQDRGSIGSAFFRFDSLDSLSINVGLDLPPKR